MLQLLFLFLGDGLANSLRPLFFSRCARLMGGCALYVLGELVGVRSRCMPVASKILAVLELVLIKMMVVQMVLVVQWMIEAARSSIPPAAVRRGGVRQAIQVINALSIEIAGEVLEFMIMVVEMMVEVEVLGSASGGPPGDTWDASVVVKVVIIPVGLDQPQAIRVASVSPHPGCWARLLELRPALSLLLSFLEGGLPLLLPELESLGPLLLQPLSSLQDTRSDLLSGLLGPLSIPDICLELPDLLEHFLPGVLHKQLLPLELLGFSVELYGLALNLLGLADLFGLPLPFFLSFDHLLLLALDGGLPLGLSTLGGLLPELYPQLLSLLNF